MAIQLYQPHSIAPFSTIFQTVENPLSEGGIWVNTDSNSTLPQVSATGKCHGTQTGTTAPPYNDSQAWLSTDYGDSQEVELTALVAGGLDSANREIEALNMMSNVSSFSTSFGNSETDGYETNAQHQGAYLIWGRFKRAEIDRIASPPTFSTGDKYRVRVTNIRTGGVISSVQCRAWYNDGALTWTNSGTTVATYLGDVNDATGNKFPLGLKLGCGFWRDSSPLNSDFAISKFIGRNA